MNKKKKKPGKKRTKRSRRQTRRRRLFNKFLFHKQYHHGIEESAEWEWDTSRIKMLCINCYTQYYIWAHDKFQVSNWFCDDCREEISKRKWQLVKKFHKYMEATRFNKHVPITIDHGQVLGFTNSIYRCVRGKAARDVLIKTMKLGVDLTYYADPIILAHLLDVYDRVVLGVQAKRRKNDPR